jgi:hypothetical protein
VIGFVNVAVEDIVKSGHSRTLGIL